MNPFRSLRIATHRESMAYQASLIILQGVAKC